VGVDRQREKTMLENKTVLADSKISIVDDDESMRKAIKTLIESLGASVQEFPSAEEFLRFNPSDVDCLILDVKMPGVSGLELQRRLVSEGNQIPVVFVTAYYGEEQRAKAMDFGAVAFLSKPFTETELIEAVTASITRNRTQE
jgi:FixJ family two-component response regulator